MPQTRTNKRKTYKVCSYDYCEKENFIAYRPKEKVFKTLQG